MSSAFLGWHGLLLQYKKTVGIRGVISRAQDSAVLDANAFRRQMPSPQTHPSAVLQRPAPACALVLAALVQCSYMNALAAGHTDRGGVVPAHFDQIKNLAFTVRRVLRRAVRVSADVEGMRLHGDGRAESELVRNKGAPVAAKLRKKNGRVGRSDGWKQSKAWRQQTCSLLLPWAGVKFVTGTDETKTLH